MELTSKFGPQGNSVSGTSEQELPPPPKKPNHYIEAQCWHMLRHVDSVSDPKEREKILRRLNSFIRELRGMAGRVDWRVVTFASSSATLMILLLVYSSYKHESRVRRYRSPADKFQIVKRFDAFNYQFRRLHYDESGRLVSQQPLHAKFCDGFTPPFSAGETLTYLAYEDLGSCWFIEADGLGYDFELDQRGHDSLAPNCHEGERIVECVPILNEANFPKEN